MAGPASARPISPAIDPDLALLTPLPGVRGTRPALLLFAVRTSGDEDGWLVDIILTLLGENRNGLLADEASPPFVRFGAGVDAGFAAADEASPMSSSLLFSFPSAPFGAEL